MGTLHFCRRLRDRSKCYKRLGLPIAFPNIAFIQHRQLPTSSCRLLLFQCPPLLFTAMHSALIVATWASVAFSIPAPQLINLDAIDAYNPVLVAAPLDVEQNTPPEEPAAPIQPITTVAASSSKKRSAEVEKRDGNCAPQPTGSGPVSDPDTVSAFQANPTYSVCSPILLIAKLL